MVLGRRAGRGPRPWGRRAQLGGGPAHPRSTRCCVALADRLASRISPRLSTSPQHRPQSSLLGDAEARRPQPNGAAGIALASELTVKRNNDLLGFESSSISGLTGSAVSSLRSDELVEESNVDLARYVNDVLVRFGPAHAELVTGPAKDAADVRRVVRERIPRPRPVTPAGVLETASVRVDGSNRAADAAASDRRGAAASPRARCAARASSRDRAAG